MNLTKAVSDEVVDEKVEESVIYVKSRVVIRPLCKISLKQMKSGRENLVNGQTDGRKKVNLLGPADEVRTKNVQEFAKICLKYKALPFDRGDKRHVVFGMIQDIGVLHEFDT